jgi:hypothetical protein
VDDVRNVLLYYSKRRKAVKSYESYWYKDLRKVLSQTLTNVNTASARVYKG